MNNKNKKIFILASLIAMLAIAGGNVFASPQLFTSPEYEATSGQFYGDADNFIHPSYYNDVEFDKWFGAVSFQSNFIPNQASQVQMIQVGTAAKIGGLYAALYYGGNIFADNTVQQYTIRDGKRIYTSEPYPYNIHPDFGFVTPYNEASVLIGIADMGFRLSWVQSYKSTKLDDFFIGTSLQENFTSQYGSLNPQIAWGMAKELIPGKGLMPQVYLDLDFFRDYESYNTGGGDEIRRSNNVFSIGLDVRSGQFSFLKKNNFDFGIDVWYNLDLAMFNNNYTPSAGNLVNYKGANGALMSYNGHELLPWLYTTWSGERIELSAELGLGLGLSSFKSTDIDLTSAALLEAGPEISTLDFSFYPTLDLGMRWSIVPNKFFMNAGGNIQFFNVNLSTENVGEFNDGIDNHPSYTSIENTFDGAVTSLLLGFTLYITPNIGIQAMSGIYSGRDGTNNIKIFGIETGNVPNTGIGVFSKLMVTLKF